MHLLLSMDPGVDDALALLLAARSSGVTIVGIGASCGNVGPRAGALNALRTLAAAGVAPAYPVCRGREEPLSGRPPRGPTDASFIHGSGGLGSNSQPEPDPALLSPLSALELILSIYQAPSEVVLVVTGPLTDVAAALREAPGIAAHIPRLVFMGGAFGVPGNVAPCGEFNVWLDPVAAAEVFDSRIPMTVVGLDVTHQCSLGREEIREYLRPEQWPLGQYVEEITGHYLDWSARHEGFAGCYLHDPLAVAVALRPDLVWTRPYRVRVITDRESPAFAMTVIDRRDRGMAEPPAKDIALQVDSAALRRMLWQALGPPEP